jgi:hypothetical protein
LLQLLQQLLQQRCSCFSSSSFSLLQLLQQL